MHELRRLKPTTNEIFMRMFSLKFFVQVITRYCSQLCVTRFTAVNIAHVVVNIDSEGLWKPTILCPSFLRRYRISEGDS